MGYTWSFVVLLLAVGCYMYFRGDGFDPESLRNQRILVTGASSGIGEQLAYQYSRLGARLVITARRAKELHRVAEHCRELGAEQIETVEADMKKADDRSRLVKTVEERLGGLDTLILNHAVLRSAWWLGNPENMSVLHHDMEVNFASFVDIASKAMPALITSGGRLGIVSSGCGKLACPLFSHYAAAKFALHGFFSSWRQELNVRKSGVSVTMCVLGLINTEKAMDVLREHMPSMDTSIAAPPDDCALAIVKSVAARTTEMYYPGYVLYFSFLHRLFPDFVESHNAENMVQFMK